MTDPAIREIRCTSCGGPLPPNIAADPTTPDVCRSCFLAKVAAREIMAVYRREAQKIAEAFEPLLGANDE